MIVNQNFLGGGGCKTVNLPWGEYGYFLELHIKMCKCSGDWQVLHDISLFLLQILVTGLAGMASAVKPGNYCRVSDVLNIGVSNGHRNFQLLAKVGLCLICSQNLGKCSLAHARKIFAIARMLGFSLKFARFLKIP